MKVRLTQIDGSLPNLALMRLSAWHRARGDEVHFTRHAQRDLFEPRYDIVYGSAIFKFSAPKLERFLREWPEAIIGGTGTTASWAVEDFAPGADAADYSIYPGYRASLGFTQRGCRLKCKFCVVPAKEGKPRPASTIPSIWRGPGHPRHLHLLDNDFFGQPAGALAGAHPGDPPRRLQVFFRGIDTLERAGIPSSHVMACMLVGFDPAETMERILYRFTRMTERGIRPYPMPFDQRRRDLKAFQRWAVTGLYRAVPWAEYRDPRIQRAA